MIKFNTLGDAIRLAEAAHFTQVDKAGLPYIEHPKRVLEKVKAQGALPYVQMAAILHDVTEDTKYTPEILLALGYPESAVDIIKLLDRDYSKNVFLDRDWWAHQQPTKEEIDKFYYEQIAKNPGAKMVKLADIEDNLSEWRLTYLSDETQDRLRAKYAKAKQILSPSLANIPRPVPMPLWRDEPATTSNAVWT